MTGVEVALIAGAVAAFGAGAGGVGIAGTVKDNRVSREKKTAEELYRTYIQGDLGDAPQQVTSIGGKLPSNLDPHAAACIRIIETYQRQRKGTFAGMVPMASEFSGDTRTVVLEELKQWLLTLSLDGVNGEDIANRIEYLRQLLLRPDVFSCSNTYSFRSSVAQVCKQLEDVLNLAVTRQRTCAAIFKALLETGREEIVSSATIFLFTLADRLVLTELGLESQDVPQHPTVATLLLRPEAKRPNDVRQVLEALLSSSHVRKVLGELEVDNDDQNNVVKESFTGNFVTPLSGVLQELEGRWEKNVGSNSGLSPAFRTAAHREDRRSYLNFVLQVERVAYFMSLMLPYKRLAEIGGDVVICRAHQNLAPILQELEGALLMHRQATLEVISSAKRELQEVAKNFGKASSAETQWMKGLRLIDEVRSEELHAASVARVAELRDVGTATRALQLQVIAQQSLGDLSAMLSSPEFQARCKEALPDNAVADMKAIAGALPPLQPLTHGG
eukprot:CAMPEP_0194517412 /NCGR_PEP_ID=MMETSP0253-20130528/50575_1 /TAXON_ID=2966 /ORGANISM="Noctiluca scintillans" /LENGTH=501 /DNA_ID=CAMNT_0039361369 /DNA_START=41 /DNA_END=1543 /DNA_ORIENTATION=-